MSYFVSFTLIYYYFSCFNIFFHVQLTFYPYYKADMQLYICMYSVVHALPAHFARLYSCTLHSSPLPPTVYPHNKATTRKLNRPSMRIRLYVCVNIDTHIHMIYVSILVISTLFETIILSKAELLTKAQLPTDAIYKLLCITVGVVVV